MDGAVRPEGQADTPPRPGLSLLFLWPLRPRDKPPTPHHPARIKALLQLTHQVRVRNRLAPHRKAALEFHRPGLQHGVAAMRMLTGGLLSNGAFLTCARLAHNLKSWLAQLALPLEALRWEWKRFRMSFVYVAARVVRRARCVHVEFAASHRQLGLILAAQARLQI